MIVDDTFDMGPLAARFVRATPLNGLLCGKRRKPGHFARVPVPIIGSMAAVKSPLVCLLLASVCACNDAPSDAPADAQLDAAPDANLAPIADAGPDTTYLIGGPFALNGSASTDPDGTLVSYQWTVESRPAGSTATVANELDAVASFTPDKLGTYSFALLVTDNGGSTASDTVTVGAMIVFVVGHRFPGKGSGKRERRSVLWTNLALAGLLASLVALAGWKAVLLVQAPILFIGNSIGVWMFYIQHNFEGTYWERQEKWDFLKAGMQGSSFYRLPGILQWFTGNIGYHHIHHLSPRIPNYKLQTCHEENSIFQVKPLTILTSLKSLRLRLWDEEKKQLVGYQALKTNNLSPING